MLEKLLRSKAEVRVLGIVLFEEGLHLREIARRADVSPYEAKRELDNLVELGILFCERKGNQTSFFTDKSCPFLDDLRNLYQKTEGLFSQLRHVLKEIEGIEFALIFGSTAQRKERKTSDVDLMIVGDADENEVTLKIFKIQKTMRREINFILWTADDFEEKIERGSSFLRNVIKNRKVFLIGDEDEFIRIIEKRHDKKSGS